MHAQRGIVLPIPSVRLYICPMTLLYLPISVITLVPSDRRRTSFGKVTHVGRGHAPSPGQFFVTQLLTRDLFAVANVFVIIYYVGVKVQNFIARLF